MSGGMGVRSKPMDEATLERRGLWWGQVACFACSCTRLGDFSCISPQDG